MDFRTSTRHPVLHYLAVMRAGRDFGLDRHQLDPLALRFSHASDSTEKLAEAATTALLQRG
jgi:hypothetical protein